MTDEAKAVVLIAVTAVGSQAGEGGDLVAIGSVEFGQESQQDGGREQTNTLAQKQ